VALPTRYISLFSGVGGLDLAVKLALPDAQCVCMVEGEIPAAEVLAARMHEGSLDDAPIWSDVRTFRSEPWRGLVDGIVGGFPCTDLSVAGKRAGIDGEKSGLWGEFRRIIDEAKPGWVFIENVPGLVSSLTLLHRSDILEHYDRLRDAAKTARDRWYVEAHIERLHRRLLKEHGISALLYVCCQLEELGYRVAVEEIAASDVGAPHKRERVFILAYATGRGSTGQGWWQSKNQKRSGSEGEWRGFLDELIIDCRALALPSQRGRGELREPSGGDGQPHGGGGAVEHTESELRGTPGTHKTQAGSGVASRHSGEQLANPGDRLIPQQGRGSEGRTGAGSAGEAVDDSPSPRLGRRESEEGTAPRDEARMRESGGRCDAVADTGCAGERRAAEQAELDRQRAPSHDSGTGRTLFPPGPNDTDAWSEVLVRRPWMRPAISQAEIESALCNVPDELARLVVSQRTDALRAAGNGVVALQGAVAFVELVRRLQQ